MMWLYGALTAVGALIMFASTNHYVEALIGAPLFGVGALCLLVELMFGWPE